MRIIYSILFAALLAIAPTAVWCGNVVTNATGLLPCLGYEGTHWGQTLNGDRPFMGNSRIRRVEVHATLGVGREWTRPGGGPCCGAFSP